MIEKKSLLLWDLVFMACVVATGMQVADYFENDIDSEWVGRTQNWSLGAEYNSIAQSIFAGRGFSDPFATPTGPTAWMPPVYPYFLASLYWLTDFQPTAVVDIVLGLKATCIIFTGVIVIREARFSGFAWLGYIAMPMALMANFSDYFQATHDVWLLVLLVDLIWLGSVHFWFPASSFAKSICWGVFGGFCALCSPVLGCSWAACVIASAFMRKSVKSNNPVKERPIQKLLLIATAAAITVSPWMIRNRVILGGWIPIKSNSSFEVWQSLCVDKDGVLDANTLSKHPWPSNGSERALYVEQGEVRFLEQKWLPVFESLQTSPRTAVWKLGNRAVASLIYYYRYRDDDIKKTWPMLFKRIVFPLPFISLMALMACGCIQKVPKLAFAAVLYITVLAPYVLISYYDRYAAPLLPIKLILVLNLFALVKTHICHAPIIGTPLDCEFSYESIQAWNSFLTNPKCERTRAFF